MSSILPKPNLSSHPVDVGTRSEAAIVGTLIKRGYEVLVPSGVNHRYDLVIDVGTRVLRAQCKTGRLRNGVITFRTVSVRINTQGWFIRNYAGEVDVFLVYCPENDRVYCIPIEDCPPARQCTLRISPTANNQQVGVRWARDYELPE